MYTAEGSCILHQRGLLFGECNDHLHKRPVENWPKIQAVLTESFKKTFLRCDSLKMYKKCRGSKFCFQSNRDQVRRQKPNKVEATSRRDYLLAFPGVLEFSSFYTVLMRPWLANLSATANDDAFPEYGPGRAPGEKVVQDLPFTARVMRPRMGSVQSEDELEEVLAVKLKLFRGKACGFNVFIDLPTADEQTPITCSEYAGSYFHEARRVKKPELTFQETLFNIGIGDIIKDLGLLEQPNILVTFVPSQLNKDFPITVESMSIVLE